MRPIVGTLAGVGAVAAFAAVAPTVSISIAASLFCAYFCACCGGFVINDYFDLDKDRLCHPERPLPQGLLRRRTALGLAVVLLTAAVAAVVPLGRGPAIFMVLIVFLLVVYSKVLMWNGVAANVLAAFLGCSFIAMGGLLGGRLMPLAPAVVFIMLVMLIREIVFDIRDAPADEAFGLRSLPVLVGVDRAFEAAWLVFGLLVMTVIGAVAVGLVQVTVVSVGAGLGSIGLLGVALRHCDRVRSPCGFVRFAHWTRVGLAAAIPALFSATVFARHDGAVAESALAPTGGLSVPDGVGAFCVAAVAATFFFVAIILVGQVAKLSPEPLARFDKRWRFYSIFGWLMLIVFVQNLTYALFAGNDGGVFSFENGPLWLYWLLLGQGFVVLPVSWVELVYSRNWSELGFTRRYEETLQEISPQFLESYYEKRGLGSTLQRIAAGGGGFWGRFPWPLVFLLAWVWIYVFSPALGIHVKKSFNDDSLGPAGLRRLQASQDIFVMLTVWVYLGCLAMSVGSWVFDLPAPRAAFVEEGVSALIVGALLLAGVALSRATNAEKDKGQKWAPWWWLVAYLVAVVLDAFSAPVFWLGDNVLTYFFGGWGPIVLLGFLGFLLRRFLQETRGVQDFSLKILLQGISGNLADRALHRLNNRIVPIRGALDFCNERLTDADSIKTLIDDARSLDIVRRQVRLGLESLDGMTGEIEGFKSRVRPQAVAEWDGAGRILELVKKHVPTSSDVQVELPGGNPPGNVEVRLEWNVFEDVIANLIDNAVAAMRSSTSEQSRIYVSFGYQRDNDFPLSVRIRDNGPGISRQLRQRVFEPYFSTKGSGSGLGLTVVKEFFRHIEGKIELSDMNTRNTGGAELVLYFPQARVRRRSQE